MHVRHPRGGFPRLQVLVTWSELYRPGSFSLYRFVLKHSFIADARYIQQPFISAMSLISDMRAYFLRGFASFTIANPKINPTAAPTVHPPKCRFRLDNDSSDTLTLPDGRKVGYAQYGSRKGRAIFYLHGLPGSRIEAAAWDELGLKLGAHIIAADRPGIGWSSPHPDRTLLDHPKDLEYLAQHLELDEYSVLVQAIHYPYEYLRLFTDAS
jgi:alpha/beta hydrolase fold